MAKLNPEKLSVEYRQQVTPTEPIIGRKYTLTHSDITAELFLIIGLQYATDKITAMRDEVLGEWCKANNQYYLNIYLHIDGEYGPANAAVRNMVFRRELPLALQAIRYGDRELFATHSELDEARIIVYFNSTIPYYNRIEDWGTPADYQINEEQARMEFRKPKDYEQIIITLLNPYIRNEIYRLYGRNVKFCLNETKILSAEELNTQDKCKSHYNIAVGLRVGKNPPTYNNVIIEFIVTPNSVKTKSIKNPRQ